jgi:hypothetical protein
MNNALEIKVGQTWGDLHKDTRDKYCRVDSTGETHAECTGVQTGKKVSIRRDRLKPGSKRYFLAVDNEIVEEVNRLSVPTAETKAEPPTDQKTAAEAGSKLEAATEAETGPKTEPKPKTKKKTKPASAETPTTE